MPPFPNNQNSIKFERIDSNNAKSKLHHDYTTENPSTSSYDEQDLQISSPAIESTKELTTINPTYNEQDQQTPYPMVKTTNEQSVEDLCEGCDSIESNDLDQSMDDEENASGDYDYKNIFINPLVYRPPWFKHNKIGNVGDENPSTSSYNIQDQQTPYPIVKTTDEQNAEDLYEGSASFEVNDLDQSIDDEEITSGDYDCDDFVIDSLVYRPPWFKHNKIGNVGDENLNENLENNDDSFTADEFIFNDQFQNRYESNNNNLNHLENGSTIALFEMGKDAVIFVVGMFLGLILMLLYKKKKPRKSGYQKLVEDKLPK